MLWLKLFGAVVLLSLVAACGWADDSQPLGLDAERVIDLIDTPGSWDRTDIKIDGFSAEADYRNADDPSDLVPPEGYVAITRSAIPLVGYRTVATFEGPAPSLDTICRIDVDLPDGAEGGVIRVSVLCLDR